MADNANKDDLGAEMLAVIYRRIEGFCGRSTSMWEVGEEMGLDRAQAEMLAMGLVNDGLVEIKSLSGGLTLTEAGLGLAAGVSGGGAQTETGLSDFADQALSALPQLNLDVPTRADLEIDLTILKAQAERSRPVAPVVAATLEEIRSALATGDAKTAAPLLGVLAGLARGVNE